jgi:hypothetical protein
MRKTAKIFGWILLVVGILGFISNPLVGSDGLFMTDGLHNIIHLVSGAILLWAAYKAMGSVAMWLKILGVIYLLVAILGLASGSAVGMAMNGADNVLHIVLAVVFLWVGFKKKGAAMAQAM